MAPDFLAQSGPPELILDILEKCESIRDVLSFATTCRRLYRIWQAGAASVLWPAPIRKDPEFDDALIASRLTTLVYEAEARGELPPMALSPGDFSGHRQIPTVPEIKAATAFSRLVNFLAIGASCLDIDVPDDRAGSRALPTDEPEYGPEDSARMPEWEARVRKALYRFFTCAAALAGAYNEPLFRARASDDPVIKNLVHRFYDEQDRALGLSDHELDFLERFTVCNVRASPEAEEAVFGPLCDWLLHSILSDSGSRQAYADRFEKGFGRALCCPNIDGDGSCPYPDELTRGGSHSDAHFVVWEITKMIWLDHHFTEMVIPWSFCQCYSAERICEINRPLQTAVAVFFGVFRAEEAVLADQTGRHNYHNLVTDFAVSREGDHDVLDDSNPLDPDFRFDFYARRETKPSVALFFNCIDRSERSPKFTNTSAAPLRFKFLYFFIRRSTGIRMATYAEAFSWAYHDAVGNYGIFAHDDVGGREANIDMFDGFNDGSMFL
ncbi:hypothetical protein RB595_004324 [Gaeumannomyces hyphopodioides]